jgi:DNA-binding NtrC family response regulator
MGSCRLCFRVLQYLFNGRPAKQALKESTEYLNRLINRMGDPVFVEKIRSAGQSAASLTSQLLAFSRKQVQQPEILDFNYMVLTDLITPEIGGKDLILRLEMARPGIKALYVTGYTDGSIVHPRILDSTIALLRKPFTVEGLLRKVREVLDSHPRAAAGPQAI